MRLPVSRALPLAALILVAACGSVSRPADLAVQPANGPGADYPVTIGEALVVDGVTYTPKDTMNYDAVGHAVAGMDGGNAVSGAHRTLPLPCYVEVTSLETGRTILVRIERRGPMSGKALVELSPGASAQLGLAGEASTPVRVRRVNPVEPERALLRAGQSAPLRMDTPKSLLGVLQRKLATQEGVARPAAVADTAVASVPEPQADTRPTPKPAAQPAQARLVVQIGAYASKANADAAARKSGGAANQAGKLWVVRLGPFADRNEAQAALARARTAGYSDARIQRAN